jgi:hypothetical protein
MGAFALYTGIMAWKNPNSQFVQSTLMDRYAPEAEADPISRFFGWTREKAGPKNVSTFRIIGPIIGTVFLGVGLWMLVSELGCAVHLPNLQRYVGLPRYVPLSPSYYFFIAVAILIGVMNAWRMKPLSKVVEILSAAIFGFAGAEGVQLGGGVQTDRWFAVSLIVGIVAYCICWLDSKSGRNYSAACNASQNAGDPVMNHGNPEL